MKINSNWNYVNESDAADAQFVEVQEARIDGNKPVIDNFAFFGQPKSRMSVETDSSGNTFLVNSSGNLFKLLPPADSFKDGLTWKYSDLLTAYMTLNPGSVKTPAGDFSCIYVNFTDGFTFSYEMWLARDIGIVKWGANRTNPPTLKPVYYVLKEFKK